MEKLVRPGGPVRFIGVSNFSPKQMKEVLAIATIKPKVHQFELHPYLQQSDFMEKNFKHGIQIVCYALLGNTNQVHNLGVSRSRGLRAPNILTQPVINNIAKTRLHPSASGSG